MKNSAITYIASTILAGFMGVVCFFYLRKELLYMAILCLGVFAIIDRNIAQVLLRRDPLCRDSRQYFDTINFRSASANDVKFGIMFVTATLSFFLFLVALMTLTALSALRM
jgi:hypothetical protein